MAKDLDTGEYTRVDDMECDEEDYCSEFSVASNKSLLVCHQKDLVAMATDDNMVQAFTYDVRLWFVVAIVTATHILQPSFPPSIVSHSFPFSLPPSNPPTVPPLYLFSFLSPYTRQ